MLEIQQPNVAERAKEEKSDAHVRKNSIHQGKLHSSTIAEHSVSSIILGCLCFSKFRRTQRSTSCTTTGGYVYLAVSSDHLVMKLISMCSDRSVRAEAI